jgi:MFS family permease
LNVFDQIRAWIDFLRRQDNPFKVNILKNLAQRFASNLSYQYQYIYMTELGAGPIILGYISSLSGLVNTILAIPAGIIADKYGLKNVFLFNISFSILSALLFGFSSSWQLATLALTLSTVSMILDRTACPMICGSTLASHERTTGMGICDTISFFPNLIAPMIGAYLITVFGGMNVAGIRPLYFIQIIGYIVAFYIIYSRFENPKIMHKNPSERGLIQSLGEVLSKGIMVRRWILMTMFSAFAWQVMFYIPIYAKEFLGADQYIIGGMSTASTIVFVFLAIPLGHLADTRGRKKMAIVTTLLYVSSYLVLLYSPNILFLILSGFLSGFMMPSGQAMMAIAPELVPSEYLGRWYGLLGFFRGLVGIVSPIICGYVWDVVNPQMVFVLIGFTQLVSLGIFLTVPTSITK